MTFCNQIGTNDYDINIYCNISNICKIKCESIDACNNVHLHCFDIEQCFVDCFDGSNNCLAYGIYSIWTTMSPTIIPTLTPNTITHIECHNA